MGAARLSIEGQLDLVAFVPWICHRARLLDLTGWVTPGERCFEVVVAGPTPLIDAMEVACSLGPAEVLVHEITRTKIDLPVWPTGFAPSEAKAW